MSPITSGNSSTDADWRIGTIHPPTYTSWRRKKSGDMISYHNSIAYSRGHGGRLWVLRSRRGKQQCGKQQPTQSREKTTQQLTGNRGDGPWRRRRRCCDPKRWTPIVFWSSSFHISMYNWLFEGENASAEGRMRPEAVDCSLEHFFSNGRQNLKAVTRRHFH